MPLQGSFSPKTFIEKLSSGIIATRIKENSNTFDPKPFIRTFESSLEELEKLASKMQKHTIELERETQKEEIAFKKEVKELGSGFEVRDTCHSRTLLMNGDNSILRKKRPFKLIECAIDAGKSGLANQ